MSKNTPQNGVLDPKTIGYLQTLAAGGEEGFVRDLVALFLTHTPPLIERLREKVAHWDAGEVEKAAHRLRGSSLNLGAVAMAEVCGEIETRGREDQPDALGPLVERLAAAFSAAEKDLRALP